MKNSLTILTAALLMGYGISASADTPQSDVLLTVHSYLPSEKEDWDRASGVEMQARFWNGSGIGAALSVGIDSWTATSEYVEEEDDESYFSSSIYGDTTIIPVGLSALFRGQVTERTTFVFEAGFRYGFTDSNISAETAYEDDVDSIYLIDTVETDNAMLGVLGFSMETELVTGLWLHGGMRYQFDLIEAHETFMGDDLGTTSFQAASLDLGLAWNF